MTAMMQAFVLSRGAELLAVNSDGNMPYDICENKATLDYIEMEMTKRGVKVFADSSSSVLRLYHKYLSGICLTLNIEAYHICIVCVYCMCCVYCERCVYCLICMHTVQVVYVQCNLCNV